MQQDNAPKKEMYTVKDFLKVFSISRSCFYDEVKCGRLKVVKLRSRTYVIREDAEDWKTLLKLGAAKLD